MLEKLRKQINQEQQALDNGTLSKSDLIERCKKLCEYIESLNKGIK